MKERKASKRCFNSRMQIAPPPPTESAYADDRLACRCQHVETLSSQGVCVCAKFVYDNFSQLVWVDVLLMVKPTITDVTAVTFSLIWARKQVPPSLRTPTDNEPINQSMS